MAVSPERRILVELRSDPTIDGLKLNREELWYAATLERQRREGLIREWGVKTMRFRLGHLCYYEPDFHVITNDHHLELHEYKGASGKFGQVPPAGMVKVKLAAQLYPWAVWRLVKKIPKKDGGGYDIREMPPRPLRGNSSVGECSDVGQPSLPGVGVGSSAAPVGAAEEEG